MGIAWAVIIFFFCLLILGIVGNSEERVNESRMLDDGYSIINYLGGNPHIERTSFGLMRVREESLHYIEKDMGQNHNYGISYDKIKSIEVKSHEQITKDVTAGRLLLFGIFAFAAKKQTVHTKQYLVIHCEEEGVIYDMVFTGVNMGAWASNINRALIDYRRSLKTGPQTAVAGN